MGARLEQARDAAACGSWAEAFELFAQLDPTRLSPGDLEVMADAAWWSCRIDDAIAVRQNAYAGYLNAKDLRRAGSAAWRISEDFAIKGESAAGLGWLKRAQRHLSSEPECIERGFLAVTESDVARTSGDLAQARSHAARAVELGERCDSLDLHAMGIQALGRTMIASGEIREGMALLDEAMALVLSRRLNPLFTGIIYCNVVAACMARADLGRASEWTEAAMAWCGSIADLTPYHGICRMHRVEIMTLRGAWDRAEAEALQTVQEMHGLEQHVAAEALYAIGEIHLHRGELDEAEDWFMRAYEKGRDPQPGLAAVRVAQGKVDAAATGIRLALASAPEPTLHRARLLAAQVDVLLEHRDLPAAWKAAEELERLTSETPSPLLDVITMMARASLHLAGDEIDEALRDARRAWSLSQQLKLPHFAAKARMITGLVAGRMGDIDRARIELEAARTEFERLGASLDVRAVSEHLRAAIERPGGLSARELEVLRMVAAGRTNREIAAVLVISEKTVSRHLENIFRKLDVSSRAAATAFAFKHELV